MLNERMPLSMGLAPDCSRLITVYGIAVGRGPLIKFRQDHSENDVSLSIEATAPPMTKSNRKIFTRFFSVLLHVGLMTQ